MAVAGGGGAPGETEGSQSPAPGGLAREWAAFRELLVLVVPISAASIMSVLADRWTLAFVGHWDYKDVAHYDGAGIGKMYSNITALSLGIAATIGLSTFCSQAHGAGCSSEKNPIFVRRAALLLLGCFVFALTAALACEPLLLALRQPPAVAETSARFAQAQLIGVPFWWMSNCMNIALNSAKYTRPGLTMSGISSLAQAGFAALLCDPAIGGLGYMGMAVARSLGGLTSAVVILTHIKLAGLEHLVWRRQPGADPVLKAGAFKQYLAVSVPSALVVWSEWWAFEVLSLFVGWTANSKVSLAAHGTMFNVIVPMYMIWAGTSTALCALIGNKLGSGGNADIPPLLRAAFAWSAASSLFIALGYEIGKSWLAEAFTADVAVQALITSSSLGVVLSVLFYAQLMTFFGALRGANFQKPGILGTFVGYWIIGLPLGGVLGVLLRWPTPLLGVWLGNVTALLIAASWVLLAVFVRIDWRTVRRVDGAASSTSLLGARSRECAAPSLGCAEERTSRDV